MEILHIQNLSFTYPNMNKKALDNIDITIGGGEFIVVCGESGCGKTTLLKMLKREISPYGEKEGKILYGGTEISQLDERSAAAEIGFVMQNPEQQVVTDKVWHELAFGLENLGYQTEFIRRRVGEMASYFGIEEWFRKNTNELSGGQKQLLNLAAVMAMSPKILILDEPTSMLDPIAASDFIGTLGKLNRELGLTIILSEHRLEEVFPVADKVLVMEDGRTVCYDSPKNVCVKLKEHKISEGLPCAVRVYNGLGLKGQCPITVKEGRNFLSENFSNKINYLEIPEYIHESDEAVKLKNVWFRYERDLPDVMRGMDLTVYRGETFCILGGNGTGKTTALGVIAGLNRAYRGDIFIKRKKIKHYSENSLYRHNVAMLPQNPQDVFLKNTVEEDLYEICDVMKYEEKHKAQMVEKIAKKLDVFHLLKKHPYDLSGGEQQKCALAKVLLLSPEILLLDEPTKGIDAGSKHQLSQILKELKNEKITIIMVTHDVEFAALNADRCALFFDGEIVSVDTPQKFFDGNNFYTTAANRMARHMYKNVVTCKDIIDMCRKNGGING